jgi:chemotaxis protein MotB
VARRRKHQEHENHDRWLVSYADFITLLFAFFVVLYATSQSDVKKQEEFQESFKKQMNGMGGIITGSGAQGDNFNQASDFGRNRIIQTPIETFPPRGSGPGEVQQYVQRKIDEMLKDSSERATVTDIHHDAVGVRIQLAANKVFLSGAATLTDESAHTLDELGDLLKESNRRLIIEGHTDDAPIHTDKFPSNWELSAARATKIVRYLAARHKIPASKMTAIAYADQKPLAPNTTEENRARNRRIEIMIVTDDKAP